MSKKPAAKKAVNKKRQLKIETVQTVEHLLIHTDISELQIKLFSHQKYNAKTHVYYLSMADTPNLISREFETRDEAIDFIKLNYRKLKDVEYQAFAWRDRCAELFKDI